MSVEAFDAVAQAVRCQDPRFAVATLDSVLHHWLLRLDELDELFAALPRRYRRLRGLLRDLEAHRQGYIVARFDAQDILWRPEAVSEAMRRLLHARRLS